MERLIEQLNKHNYNYYILDNPTISDKEYDALYDKLIQMEKETGKVLPNSPTQKVGYKPLDKFEKHNHINKLYSLNKCNSFEELEKWALNISKQYDNPTFIIEDKYDGLTICLTYDNGKLIRGATRGDGTTGENVIEQIKTIHNVPLEIEYKGLIEIQGEGIMTWSAFREYNKTADEPLKNPRNGVAGAIRCLDPKITKSRKLSFMAYNINYIEREFDYHSQEVDFLKEQGFTTPEYNYTNNIKELLSYHQFTNVYRNKLNYLIDGVVIKVDNKKYYPLLGETEKFPRWAIAYKFEADETTTIIKDVKWQVGRTGRLTPLAILEPVELNNVLISKATLNNYNDIQKKNVKLGGRVFIRRSNDVIPEVLGNADNLGEDIIPPNKCPECNSNVIEKGAHLFCINENCKATLIARLSHFVSRDCMNIEGLSEKTLETLVDNHLINSLEDLYILNVNDLAGLGGFGAKKIANIINETEKSKTIELQNFIHSLGIQHIGNKLSKVLSNKCKSIDRFISLSRKDLEDEEGVGEIMIVDILNGINKYKHLILNLINLGISPTYTEKKKVESKSYFNNKNIVITGTLSKSRNEIAKELESCGAVIQSSINKTTDILLAGDKAGSKLEKAKKLNVKIINEEEYNKLK